MTSKRKFAADLAGHVGQEVLLRGWVHRLRELAKTTFVLLKDCSGVVQCVGETSALRGAALKVDDAIEIRGTVRIDERAKSGYEVDISGLAQLAPAAGRLPFNSSSDIGEVGLETILSYRPLSLRNEQCGDIFRVQAAILRYFREFLSENRFTEIVSSKIVASGTEGGSNLFEIKYFDRAAYLAQSPQFYKEHGVAGFERVFETGHVYRAEPHATSRHLTEYCSLDFELGFIDGPEDVIDTERRLLTHIFEKLNRDFVEVFPRFGRAPLPSMLQVPIWEFADCVARLGRSDLIDDLDPDAERQLCDLALQETGIAAVFVLGFPLKARPFYTYPRGTGGAAASFDLLFEGLEITTGGQRLHRRADLEASLASRGMDVTAFEEHLRMFDLGMPPHGGLAIGLERLTKQILNLDNLRQATLYPRDRYRVAP